MSKFQFGVEKVTTYNADDFVSINKPGEYFVATYDKFSLNFATSEWKGRTAVPLSINGLVEEITLNDCPCRFQIILGDLKGPQVNITEITPLSQSMSSDESSLYFHSKGDKKTETIRACANGKIKDQFNSTINDKCLNFSNLDDVWVLFDGSLSFSITRDIEVRLGGMVEVSSTDEEE